MKQYSVDLAALVVACVMAGPSVGWAQGAQPIEAPVVPPERAVTFDFRAGEAKQVELSVQFLRGNLPFAFDEMLTAKQIKHQKLITGGGHAWMNAQHHLAEPGQWYFKST